MNAKAAALIAYAADHSAADVEALVLRLFNLDKVWNESQHKRAKNGRFVKNGGSGSHAEARPRESETKPRNNSHFVRAGKPKDVTNEYIMTARPGKGKLLYEKGFDKSGNVQEIEIAEWLKDTFGGNVLLLNRMAHLPNKSPDYQWRGMLWDLKTPKEKTSNAYENCIKAVKEQIRESPGGIIIDLDKCGATIEEAEPIIVHRITRSLDYPLDAIILHSGRSFKILRFKTKKPQSKS